MIVDREGKLFGKVSLVDILIVLVVIVAVVGVGYKFSKTNTVSPFAKADKIYIEFYQEEVPEFVAKAVKKGDPAREVIQYSDFGRVVDIKIGDAVSWAQTADGENIPAPKEGYSSVLITMGAEGLIGQNGVTIDNSVYYVGKTVKLHVGRAEFDGRISDIRKKE